MSGGDRLRAPAFSPAIRGTVRHKFSEGSVMPRGRKNHGKRQARWFKWQKRRLIRQRKWLHVRNPDWKGYKTHHRTPYIRGFGHYHPNRRMMPLRYYLVKPKKLPRWTDGPFGGESQFVGGGRTNPRTKCFWVIKPHYPPTYRTLFIRRTALYYGKRINRETRDDRIRVGAANWYHMTKRIHDAGVPGCAIGWPVWDLLGRTPQQAILGVNL